MRGVSLRGVRVSVFPRLGLGDGRANRLVHLHGVRLLDRFALFVRSSEDRYLLQVRHGIIQQKAVS